MESTTEPVYSKLAEIYDTVMEDVNYEVWADFIDEIIQVHHPYPVSVLELACGTGSLSLALDELGCYEVTGTDKSAAMIRQAREKARQAKADIHFRSMDFLDIDLEQTFDIVVSIFDSINYLQSPDEILHMLNEVKKVLTPNSLFIFDFTTPVNSIQAIHYLDNEEGYTANNYHFFRKSRYDANQQIHYNTFEIEKLAENQQSVLQKFTEVHQQRIYSLQEMLDIIDKTDYQIVAKYSGFDLIDADNRSLRITMVLRCPNIPS